MSHRKLLAAGLTLAALAAPGAAAAADPNPYAKGPDPTARSLQVAGGYYGVTRTTIADADTPGFGTATIWAPKGAPGETFGAVAIVPGFLEVESAVWWLGPRLAGRGFVVITIGTNASGDSPATRGDELLAALDYLTGTSAAKGIVDPSRLAVMGHSLGGGAVLEATKRRPSLKASIGLMPANTRKAWPEITTPTLIISGEDDTIAPKETQAIPLYESIPATTPKEYIEIKGGDHFSSVQPSIATAASSISWLKRYVDDDRRYTPFIAPFPYAVPLRYMSAARQSSVS